MSWGAVNVHHSPLYSWTVLFCFFFPFAAFAFLRRRATSPAPVAAMFLPLVLAIGTTWVGLSNSLRGMALSGGGRASTAAGFAEALAAPAVTLLSISIIAFAALVRRHRPIVDGVTFAIAAALVADFAGALIFARFFTLALASLAIAGAIASLVLAIICVVWFFLVVRSRVQPRPIRGGVAVFALTYVVMAVLVYQQARHYMFIAMHG